MPIKQTQIALNRVLALLTIAAIAGTLSACGRYGRPVRPKATFDVAAGAYHMAAGAYHMAAGAYFAAGAYRATDVDRATTGVYGATGVEMMQSARIEKSNRNELRTAAGVAPSVLRSSD